MRSKKDKASERGTINQRAEVDGHKSAILAPAQDAGLRVPAPLSALGVERWVARRETRATGPPPTHEGLTLSESRSGSAWHKRYRKDFGSRHSVCRVVRK